MQTISVSDLHERMGDSALMEKSLIIDVRTPEEYAEGHIPQALNKPLDKIEMFIDSLKAYENVFVHCRTGGRSGRACSVFDEAGGINAYNIEGGVEAWMAAGFEIEQ